ncbi:MAG: hypothetical protein OQK46_07970 [Gammaproteobacteria bacterium]|nr:hypothetical protein [Gammaproteobacteria bacterium]
MIIHSKQQHVSTWTSNPARLTSLEEALAQLLQTVLTSLYYYYIRSSLSIY